MVQTVNLRKVAILLIALQCIGVSQADAATPKPKPSVTSAPKKKVTTPAKTKVATPKKTALAKKKVATHTKAKTVAPKKSTLTKKKRVPVKKAIIKRKYVYHKAAPKKISPLPKIKWPPAGFTSIGTAFARVPTGQELIGLLSAMSDPSEAINRCSLDPKKPSAPALACAAILVGATQKCTWWRVSSLIKGIDPANPTGRIDLGEITTLERGAAAKTIQTIFLVSPVPLQTGIMFTGIHALCGIGPSTDPVPSTTFVPAPTPSPTTTDLPTPSPTSP